MNDVQMLIYFLSNFVMVGIGSLVVGAVYVAKNRPPEAGSWLGMIVGILGFGAMVLTALNDSLSYARANTILLIQFPLIALLGAVVYYTLPALGADGKNVVVSTRVDKVGFLPFVRRSLRAQIAVFATVIILAPVFWMVLTALKSPVESVSVPPKIFFTPKIESFVFLTTERTQLQAAELEAYRSRDDLDWREKITAKRGQRITRVSDFPGQFRNSLIIAGVSTIFSVGFGVLSAYAFSRFKVPGEDDLLFFILSTRMLPPVVVTIPLFLMYRELGLYDTHLGLILLYTAFNLSFSVWLMKGFMDEIPREYEEAALVDGYTRLQAFWRIVLPQAVTGIAATTVFCFIFAWNEYAFAAMLTADKSRTAPPSIPTMQGVGRVEWETIAAASLAFLIPVVIVTFALRRHLLRGVTFGAIRKG